MAKLSNELIKNIVELADRGWSSEAICTKLVINPNTFSNWAKWGREVLEEEDEDENLAIRNIREGASRRDKQFLILCVKLVCRVQEAVGNQIGAVEEVAYEGALNSSKDAMNWLGIRAPKTWGKKSEVNMTLETRPIKQIVIHAGDNIRQIEDGNTEEAEFEDA